MVALHIFSDSLLKLLLFFGPFLSSSRLPASSWFYTMYGLGGKHLRLRFVLDKNADRSQFENELLSCAFAILDEIRAQETPGGQATLLTVRSQLMAERAKVIIAQNPTEWDDTIYAAGACHLAPYLPEFERYGGITQHDQTLLCLVDLSRICLWILQHSQSKTDKMVWAVRLFCSLRESIAPPASKPIQGSPRRPMLEWFEANRTLLNEPLEASARSETGGDLLLATTRKVSSAGSYFTGDILSSQLHMVCNRLGLGPIEEVTVLHAVSFALTGSRGSTPSLS